MKMKRPLFITTIWLLCYFISNGQIDTVQYQIGFDFTEGIYRTFEEFKNNDPYFKGKVSLLNEKSFEFSPMLPGSDSEPDPHGWIKMRKIQKEHTIWGFCLNGVIYIKHQKFYLRLMKIGALSLFNAHFHFIFDSGRINQGGPQVLEKIYQYVLNFETGNILPMKSDVLESLLEADPELYFEYMESGYAYKLNNKLAYLLKFNQRNPIYFPVY